MPGVSHRLRKAIHPQGIPWPGSVIYNALSKSRIFQHQYALVAKDVAGYCSEGSLLDVGTGPGWLLVELHRLSPRYRLTGVDISAAMVSKARQNMAESGLSDVVTIQEGSASQLPFPDSSFDCVVSTGSLHHWKDPVAGLNEVWRVLRDGGYGLIYDLVKEVPVEVKQATIREFGRFRTTLLWLHSFEEPFVTDGEMEDLARSSAFAAGTTRFVGVLCCLILRKGESPPGRS